MLNFLAKKNVDKPTSNNISDYIGKISNTLVDDIKVIVIVVDYSGTILYANKEACRAIEYSHNELIGLPVYKLMSADSIPQAMKSIASEFGGQTAPEMDIVVTTKSGNKKTFRFPSWDATQVTTDKGKVLLIWGFDITEKLQNEKLLKDKVKELEQLNKYMTGRELKMSELKKEIEILKAREK